MWCFWSSLSASGNPNNTTFLGGSSLRCNLCGTIPSRSMDSHRPPFHRRMHHHSNSTVALWDHRRSRTSWGRLALLRPFFVSCVWGSPPMAFLCIYSWVSWPAWFGIRVPRCIADLTPLSSPSRNHTAIFVSLGSPSDLPSAGAATPWSSSPWVPSNWPKTYSEAG